MVRLNLVNAADRTSITTEVDTRDSVGDLLLFAAQYWNKTDYAYVMRVGSKLVPANMTVGELGLSDNDEIEIVPDPQGG